MSAKFILTKTRAKHGTYASFQQKRYIIHLFYVNYIHFISYHETLMSNILHETQSQNVVQLF